LVDLRRIDARPLDGGPHRDRPELGRGQRAQPPEEAPDGRARAALQDDGGGLGVGLGVAHGPSRYPNPEAAGTGRTAPILGRRGAALAFSASRRSGALRPGGSGDPRAQGAGGSAIQKLTRYAWLSVAAAGATIGLKGGAYLLT